jgi:hypothetical protein
MRRRGGLEQVCASVAGLISVVSLPVSLDENPLFLVRIQTAGGIP